jgi:cyanate lyase
MLGQSPVWTAATLGGQSYLAPEDCEKIADTFELTEEECKALQT